MFKVLLLFENFMFLYKYTPKTPKMRHVNFFFNTSLVKSVFIKPFITKFYKNLQGTTLNRKKFFFKKKFFLYFYRKLRFNLAQKVIQINLLSNSQKFIIYLITSLGSYLYKPLIHGVRKELTYYNIYLYIYNILYTPIGVSNILFFFYRLHLYSNLMYGNQCIASSSGTFIKVIYFSKFRYKFIVLFPSLQKKVINPTSECTLGRNANIFKKKFITGGFFFKYSFSQKSSKTVRGVATNPVDHPNGGRSKTKGSFKTLWGKIAKAGK